MIPIHTRNRDGFALLATMWLSVAIAAVALAFALEARQARTSVMSLGASTQALVAARAGIATTLARLDYLAANGTIPPSIHPTRSLPITREDPWRYADSLLSEQVNLGGGSGYSVRVRDWNALMSLSSPSSSWRRFLEGMHFDATTADHLAQTIADWRDRDDDPQANGAERREYIAAGRIVLPHNSEIFAVSDLRDVLGMTPFIYDSIAPYISAFPFSGGGVNINTAPGPLLRTIPLFGDDIVATILSRRANGVRFNSIADLLPLVPSALANELQNGNGNIQFTTSWVEITSVGWGPDGRTRVVSHMTVGRPGSPTQVATFDWRRDD